jgi:hypothetical protein
VRAAGMPVIVTHADTAPLTDLFARVVIIGDGAAPDEATRQHIEAFAAAHGGRVVASDTLTGCGSDVVAAATLVAVGVLRSRSSWGLSDVVTDALGHCARPVLFMPRH